MEMQFFLAGIMQGSLVKLSIHDQSYRDVLRDVLRARWARRPDALRDAWTRSVALAFLRGA